MRSDPGRETTGIAAREQPPGARPHPAERHGCTLTSLDGRGCSRRQFQHLYASVARELSRLGADEQVRDLINYGFRVWGEKLRAPTIPVE